MPITYEKKTPKGNIEVQPPHKKEAKVTEVQFDPIVSDKPMANVGMKVGMTKNLGDYNSLRVDVSLYLPCENTDVAVNETFDLVENWCDLKMQGIMEEYEDSK